MYAPAPPRNPQLQYIYDNVFPFWLGAAIGLFVLLGILILLGILGVTIATIVKVYDEPNSCSSCSDGNPCTKDIKTSYGTCLNENYHNGRSCESACYDEEEDEDDTHTCQISDTCPGCSECVGTVCAGSCDSLDASDCPDINATNALATVTKRCDSMVCEYNIDLDGVYDNLTIPCTTTSPFYLNLCDNEVAAGQPIVDQNCLVSQPLCNDTSGFILSCFYSFKCAVPEWLVVV
jgi:hypothetical protein